MRIMKLAVGLATLLAVSLTGCMIAPGQYVKPDGWYSSLAEPEVEVIPITPKLIASEAGVVTVGDSLPAELLSYVPPAYRVNPGDALYITVWDHPELTVPTGTQINSSDANGRLVGADGSLFYPYIGMVAAQGKTLDELRTDIARRLAKYIESPQVDVAVLRFGSQRVYVSGAFSNTGVLPITTTPLSLAEAVGRSAINTAEADLTGFELVRDGVRYRLNLDTLALQGKMLSGILLKPDDTIYLPYNDRRKVYLLGEFNSQRALPFKTDGISLAEAVAMAGGLRQTTASARAVYVIRAIEREGAGPATTVYKLNANSAVALAMADRFNLRPGDIVFSGPAQITRWNRVISGLLPSASLVDRAQDISNQAN